MAIPDQLIYEGQSKEFQFRDKFVMPLLVRLGFGIVENQHGQREFGRDVVFGDIDRFGHVVYYGMQIKYESSISLGDSHSLVQDAEQATNNPFRHRHTGREEFISCFYVVNSGDISDAARENFFSSVVRRGIRDARLLDGNALLLLDKAASWNRNAHIRERASGLLQEVRMNRNMIQRLLPDLRAFVADPENNRFPYQRPRDTAAGNYLNAPFLVPTLEVDTVEKYWQIISMLKRLCDSIEGPISVGSFRQGRVQAIETLAPQSIVIGFTIENAVMALLEQLGSSQRP